MCRQQPWHWSCDVTTKGQEQSVTREKDDQLGFHGHQYTSATV